MREQIYMYGRISMDEKDLDQYGKLQVICNKTRMVKANVASCMEWHVWFTYRKHNKNSVIGFTLFQNVPWISYISFPQPIDFRIK